MPDCAATATRRGWCFKHYLRWRRHGDPTITLRPPSPDTCSVEGCEEPFSARGLCRKHYERWRSHGDPLDERRPGPVPIPLEERYVMDQDTDCWVFQGAKDTSGYGLVTYHRINTSAHRLAAHLWLGFDLADPRIIRHTCDNPPCINPAHLLPGTKLDNAADMVARGRQERCGDPGEGHYNAKLSAADVIAIREHAARGERYARLAESFGVSRQHIRRIVRYESRARG